MSETTLISTIDKIRLGCFYTVGSLKLEEDQRINSLLLSRLYNELAKQSMKEYKKKNR
jgi:hypothetical protein